jgi:hypothetical protein
LDNPERNPNPHKNQAPSSAADRTRLQLLARKLHRLGPKPLFHFLDEVERGADVRAHLEAYAELPGDFNSGKWRRPVHGTLLSMEGAYERPRPRHKMISVSYTILKQIQPASVRSVCYQLFNRKIISSMNK